jgi:hypothetical protein
VVTVGVLYLAGGGGFLEAGGGGFLVAAARYAWAGRRSPA